MCVRAGAGAWMAGVRVCVYTTLCVLGAGGEGRRYARGFACVPTVSISKLEGVVVPLYVRACVRACVRVYVSVCLCVCTFT